MSEDRTGETLRRWPYSAWRTPAVSSVPRARSQARSSGGGWGLEEGWRGEGSLLFWECAKIIEKVESLVTSERKKGLPTGFGFRLSFISSGLAVLFWLWAVPVRGASLDYTTFLVPGGMPVDYVFPGDINNLGQIVGSYAYPPSTAGFLRDVNGAYTSIRIPGTLDTDAAAVNDSGQILLNTTTRSPITGDTYQAFLRSANGQTLTPLAVPVPNGVLFVAGLNSQSQIAGTIQVAGVTDVGYVLNTDGTRFTFSAPGAAFTYVGGINDLGMVSGSFDDVDGERHGFIRYADGSFLTFDGPDGTGTSLVGVGGINNFGDVVGTADRTGFVRSSAGVYSPVSVPGTDIYTFAVGINDAGVIVGDYQGGDVLFGGYIAAPVPEAALTWPVFVSLVILVARNRNICKFAKVAAGATPESRDRAGLSRSIRPAAARPARLPMH
jgi:hypothetical protein